MATPFTASSSDEGHPTWTAKEQERVEEACRETYEEYRTVEGTIARDAYVPRALAQ